VKETPKGYWIREDLYFVTFEKRWVSKTARKRLAYPTKEEALQSFIRRKINQIRYCKRELYFAEGALKIAEKLRDGSNKNGKKDRP